MFLEVSKNNGVPTSIIILYTNTNLYPKQSIFDPQLKKQLQNLFDRYTINEKVEWISWLDTPNCVENMNSSASRKKGAESTSIIWI